MAPFACHMLSAATSSPMAAEIVGAHQRTCEEPFDRLLRVAASLLTNRVIVEIGTSLNVPYEDTWSCYEGGEIHCSLCGTCNERKEAFQLVVISDPTKYRE